MNRFVLIGIAWLLGAACGAHAGLSLVQRWPQGENVCADAPLRLTFDQPPKLGATGRIEVCRASDGQPVETIDVTNTLTVDRYGVTGGAYLRSEAIRIDGNVASIRLRAHALSYGETYLVRVSPGAFQDFAGVQEGWRFQVKPALPRNPDRVTVAADGRGDFCTIQGAVDQIEPFRTEAATIFICRGEYEGLVRIGRERQHVRLLGEDRKGTVIVGTNNDKLNSGWLQRCVLGVEGDDFVLENLTVRNSTPYRGSQAEAVFINADRCVLRNADFLSYQDTLNLNGRVYVADCYIEGDVDYVWGYGTACFERCELRTMHDGYLVQARNPATRSGYVFLDCLITAAPEVKKLWLARIEPLRFPASHVAFVRCRMSPQIMPAGWQLDGKPGAPPRFEESDSRDLEGRPLDLAARHPAGRKLSAKAAAALTPAAILGGADHWQPH